MNDKPNFTPWRAVRRKDGFWQVCTAKDETPGSRNNFVIADGIHSEAEAKLIVQSVNHHAALLAVVEAAKEMDKAHIAIMQANLNGNTAMQLDACDNENKTRKAFRQALAALAAVQGKETR